jgi:hypothetical protein
MPPFRAKQGLCAAAQRTVLMTPNIRLQKGVASRDSCKSLSDNGSQVCPQELWISLWMSPRAGDATRQFSHYYWFGQKIDKPFFRILSIGYRRHLT